MARFLVRGTGESSSFVFEPRHGSCPLESCVTALIFSWARPAWPGVAAQNLSFQPAPSRTWLGKQGFKVPQRRSRSSRSSGPDTSYILHRFPSSLAPKRSWGHRRRPADPGEMADQFCGVEIRHVRTYPHHRALALYIHWPLALEPP